MLPLEFLNQIADKYRLSQEQKEVFLEKFGNGKSDLEIMDIFHISDGTLRYRMSEVYKKFRIGGKGTGKAHQLLNLLTNEYQKPYSYTSSIINPLVNDLDVLVQKVRENRHEKIQNQCGTMRILDIAQPVELADIYTDVNILEEVSSQQWREISDLLQDFKPESNNFDRLGLARVRQERVPGLDAALRYSKLMVLGKPGAGKTTFLQWLAIKCDLGEFQANKLPIFIKLKNFAEDTRKDESDFSLLKYITKELRLCGIKDKSVIETIITEGRALILLDGLDEVSEECSDEFIREIRRFTEDYFKNIFIVSCRIASHKYRFQGFTDVEIADFNSEQVEAFVKKWFVVVAKNEAKKGEAVANKFISAIKQPENKQIIELAVTPILLNLTCLVFQPKSKFPLKRSELYKQGLNILLIKWDEAKDVKRDNLYRYLPLENKIELLSQLAAINFEKNQYFFEESEVERFIVDYLRTLPHTQTEQSTLYINSQIVLDSIEAQHGLLVERAKGIYSFSHLTFQEYFTAKYFVDKQNWQGLATHITKKQWREVFLLTSEMVKSSDELLRLMKEKIDVLVASDNKFQQFLVWINQKSLSIETQCQPAAIRAFYLGLACSLELYPELDLDLSFARNIDNQFVFSPRMNVDIVLARNLIRSRTLTFTYVMNFDVANRSQKRARALVKDLEFNPDIVDGELKRSLQQIKEQLPNFEETESFKEWWVVNGHNWTEQLRTIIIKHCNIGQVWQFSKEQKNFLQQYYNANKLLVECLSNSEISPEARQKLEKTLFQL